MSEKPKVAFMWTGSCGGCDCSIVNIGEKLVDIADKIDIVLWPVATDFKYGHLDDFEENEIDLCVFNGAIVTDEHEEMAEKLRKKSEVLVGFGSCSHLGGIPGLGNFFTKNEILEEIYENVEGEPAKPSCHVETGELTLPEFQENVQTLSQVVAVDYLVPGCPPALDQIKKLFTAYLEDKMPEKGAVIAGDKNLCDECPRERDVKSIKTVKRPMEVDPDPEQCLLDQGILCLGPVTRSGCGGRCIKANMPCRGCYGTTPDIEDIGAKYISSIGSLIDYTDPEKIKETAEDVKDIAGTVYRFGLPASLLKGKIKGGDN